MICHPTYVVYKIDPESHFTVLFNMIHRHYGNSFDQGNVHRVHCSRDHMFYFHKLLEEERSSSKENVDKLTYIVSVLRNWWSAAVLHFESATWCYLEKNLKSQQKLILSA